MIQQQYNRRRVCGAWSREDEYCMETTRVYVGCSRRTARQPAAKRRNKLLFFFSHPKGEETAPNERNKRLCCDEIDRLSPGRTLAESRAGQGGKLPVGACCFPREKRNGPKMKSPHRLNEEFCVSTAAVLELDLGICITASRLENELPTCAARSPEAFLWVVPLGQKLRRC